MSRYASTAESIARGTREAEKVLDRCRHPVAAADVPHTYADKFSVAEFVVCAGVEAVLAGLRCLGAGAGEALGTAHVWARDHRVQLELQHSETCTFRRRLAKEQGAQGKHAEEVRGLRGTFRKLTGAVTTVELYEWDYEAQWRVCLVRGACADNSNSTLLLAEGTNRSLVTTCSNDPPYRARTSDAPFSTDLTWLLRMLNADLAPVFAIDRTGRGCHTPRRNSDVEDALQCLSALGDWGREVYGYFVHSVFAADEEHGEDLSMCCASVFSPALPVLRQTEQSTGSPDAPLSETPSATDRASLVEESRRRLQEGLATVGASYGSSAAGVTVTAASVAYVASYLFGMHDAIEEGLDYVELLLRDQLVRAIGREVSSHDFATYMSYHCRKLFTAAAAPRPFSYAVRQPARDPEGTLELVRGTGGAAAEMETVSCRMEAPRRGTRFALDATTEVVFHGPRYLHAHCAHRFSTEPPAATTLRLRARQFGTYIAVLGVVSGPDTFVPRHAVLLQSRDDLSIPLDLEEIPSAKEFRKAVESLSPEQRRFAQAYRSMQIEATLFAVCVVQVKPQVEAVLNLPQGSLAKEVALSQQLMDLFTAQHIASDLLAYRPEAPQHETSVKGRVACVRSRAHAVAAFIAAAKKRQVEEQLECEKLREELGKQEAAEAQKTLERLVEEQGDHITEAFCSIQHPGERVHFGVRELERAQNKSSFLGSLSMPSLSLSMPGSGSSSARRPRMKWTMECPTIGMNDAEQEVVPSGEAQQPAAGEEPLAAEQRDSSTEAGGQAEAEEEEDISQLPERLEQHLGRIEGIACVRPTTIKVGGEWRRLRLKGLLAKKAEKEVLSGEALDSERAHAFAVLSALTKCGELPLVSAEMHVVTVVTHCFDETVMDTAVKRSENPVEKVEASMLLMASAVLGRPVRDLLGVPLASPAFPALLE